MKGDVMKLPKWARQEMFEERHRTLPDGTVISLYEQLYNWKLTRSTAREWPHTWSDGW